MANFIQVKDQDLCINFVNIDRVLFIAPSRTGEHTVIHLSDHLGVETDETMDEIMRKLNGREA